MSTESILWLVSILFFLGVEAATVTMVSAWFALGSLAALFASMAGAALWLQILLFMLVSVICLALLRPFAKKLFNNRVTRTNVESMVGKTGEVTETVNNIKAVGRVKLGGMTWAARSTSGEEIPAGTLVKVDRIEGVKAYITRISNT